ncbi:MAG: amidohydrolase [Chloroflexi bacterium]|nr:amidohydrolase [Chloroflexota bacterium]
MTNFRVISADSHIVEPPNLWTDYIAPAYKSRAPHLERIEGVDYFIVEGNRIGPPYGYCQAGMGEVKDKTWAGVYKGGYQPKARLDDLAKDGIDADVIYPSVGLRMYAMSDPELKTACFNAYNRWMGDFCKAFPDRLKALAMVDLADADRAAKELREAKKVGLAGVMITVEPSESSIFGGKTLDPFWAAAQEMEMPVSMHVLSNQRAINQTSEIESVLHHTIIERMLATMIFGGLFIRFPKLKIVSAENDAGWAPYLMERMDYIGGNVHRQAYMKHALIGTGKSPSDCFKQSVYLTFMRDFSGVYIRNLVGVSNLMWSSDYPHRDSTWPNSQQVIAKLFAQANEADKRAILVTNAARLYGFSVKN